MNDEVNLYGNLKEKMSNLMEIWKRTGFCFFFFLVLSSKLQNELICSCHPITELTSLFKTLKIIDTFPLRLEMSGIHPRTSCMQSEHSTI